MSVVNAAALLASAGGEYQIQRSVRLRSSAGAYFSRTPSVAGNQQKSTWSGWLKLGSFGANAAILFSAGDSSGFNRTQYFIEGNQIKVGRTVANSFTTHKASNLLLRDNAAFYHVVLALDTTLATATDRLKVWINNAQVTSWATDNAIAQNSNLDFCAAVGHYLGAQWVSGASATWDGYLTEINFIDGQALTPASFGEVDAVTGVWKPKKYAGTYGTNGFYLNFADNSAATATAIGKDSSGNSNNWTPSGISVTAGATYDSMLDVPTLWADGGNGRGNYCTMNPLMGAGAAFASGNLQVTHSAATSGSLASFELPTSGKWYWESTITQLGSNSGIGILRFNDLYLLSSGAGYGQTGGSYTYREDGAKRNNATSTAYGAAYTTGDVIGVAYDADSNTLTFYKNGVSQGTAWSSLTEKPYTPVFGASVGTANIQTLNFGQRPFAYSVPSGFRALHTGNLPEPSIRQPNKWFDATTYAGNSSTQSVVNAGAFQPDLVWIKARSSAFDNMLYDAVRGVNVNLRSNTTAAETTGSPSEFTAFNSNGFTVVSNGSQANVNLSGNSYVGWQWKEGATPGFDIVTYTGNGTAQSIAHSLGVAPKMMIVKNRSIVQDWRVAHIGLTSMGSYHLNLNATASQTNSGALVWNGTAPTSSVFSVGSDSSVNGSGNSHVAYLFSEVPGFSKFGSYVGNGAGAGTNNDGPFVFTNFRPRFVLIKRTDTTGVWFMVDAARNTYNSANAFLTANSSNAEGVGTAGSDYVDFLANGFRIINDAPDFNTSGGTYVYAAFAEAPFKYALAR